MTTMIDDDAKSKSSGGNDCGSSQSDGSMKWRKPKRPLRHVNNESEEDSGIETMSQRQQSEECVHLLLNRNLESDGNEDVLISFYSESKRRSLRVDDVLWMVCFTLTCIILDIPSVLLFNHKIYWFNLKCSFVCFSVCCFTAFLLRMIYVLRRANLRYTLLILRITFGSSLICAGLLFCLATWEVYNVWSIYITLVSMMTFFASVLGNISKMLISSMASAILLAIITTSQLHNVVRLHVTSATHSVSDEATSMDPQSSSEAYADSQSNDEKDSFFDVHASLLSILTGHERTDEDDDNGSEDDGSIPAESKTETLEPVQYDWFWNIV